MYFLLFKLYLLGKGFAAQPKSNCSEVPVSGRIADYASFEQVLVGFPIWYGSAPNVVNTFSLDR